MMTLTTWLSILSRCVASQDPALYRLIPYTEVPSSRTRAQSSAMGCSVSRMVS